MDRLNSLTEEELVNLFHCKKTEISCMEEPQTFLNQLRDYKLVPEELYQDVKKRKGKKRKHDGVYQILEWLEKENRQRAFWSCVLQDHMLNNYATLQSISNSILDGSFRMIPNAEIPGRSKEAVTEEPGPSSVSREKTVLPVNCGDKQGMLYPDKMAEGDTCILSQEHWFTPPQFEKFSGKRKSKNWKNSIDCRGTPLLNLIKEGVLQCPRIYRHSSRKRSSFTCPENSSSDVDSKQR